MSVPFFPPPVSKPLYDVKVEPDVMVPMRDGVRMATTLYLPAQAGKALPGRHPVLLHRTPYNVHEQERGMPFASWFAQRGYVVVDQDCRGCFASEGETRFLIPEAEDGFDTLQWIAQQPWAGEKVGTYGTSWSGWTQTAQAALGPQNLGVMIDTQSGSNAYTSSVRHNGALELRFVAWAFWHSATNSQAALKKDPWVDGVLNLGAPGFKDWLSRLPLRPGQTELRLVPSYEDWAIELATRADYDEDYWGHPSMNPSKYWGDYPDCATLYVGGWYDSYTRGTFESFVGHSAVAQKAGRTAPIRVLMGPWTHGTLRMETQVSGNVDFGEAAKLPSFRELHLHWYETFLKGKDSALADSPVASEAPVHLFVMGGGSAGQASGSMTSGGLLFHGGRWRAEQEWPLARTQYTPFYLQADGSLSGSAPTDADSSTTYRFDPANPVPSIGGNVSSLRTLRDLPPGRTDIEATPPSSRAEEIMLNGGFDQVEGPKFFGCKPPYLPLGSRPDVLVFQTAPLAQDLEVTGPIEVKLWVASSAVDTDFTAKLIDVYPPNAAYPMGYHLNLTDSIQRLRYRKGDGKADFLPPGTAEEITITLYPTSNLFCAGHRIRLDISSSNFPRFDVNPNTGEAIGTERNRVVALNTVFHEQGRASRIILPIIPA